MREELTAKVETSRHRSWEQVGNCLSEFQIISHNFSHARTTQFHVHTNLITEVLWYLDIILMLRPINGIDVNSLLDHFPEWARNEVSAPQSKIQQVTPHFS